MKTLIDIMLKLIDSVRMQMELLLSPKSNLSGQGSSDLHISETGLDLICRFEGFSSHVYNDVAGHPTIGYGHKLQPYESYTTISEAAARKLLLQDVSFAEKAVNSYVETKLTQSQFDAIVSFVYNVGSSAFEKSTFLKLINNNEFKAASHELLKWNHAGGQAYTGLLNRRQEEALMIYRAK